MHTKDCNIKINDIAISYNDLGESRLPLIFIHGFPFDKSSWEFQLNYLSPFNRVITYDIRGFGKTETGNKIITIEQLANDFIAFMDGLNIPKAFVCGLSMGGYILLNALAKYPNRFSAIVLSNTQCLADTPGSVENRKRNIQLIEAGKVDEYIKNSIPNLFHEETIASNKAVVASIQKTMENTLPQTLTATLLALANRKHTCSVLDKITIPTLIISSKHDKAISYQQSILMQQKINGSSIAFINKAGHLPNLECYKEFNQLIKDFITSRDA